MRDCLRSLLAAFSFLLVATAAGAALAQGDHAAARSATLALAYPNVAHIGIVARDLDKAVGDVKTLFNLDQSKVVTRVTLNIIDGIYRGKKVSFSAEFCLLEFGNIQIEFIQPLKGDPSPYSDALMGKSDAVVHHVAFVVSSIDKQIASDRERIPTLNVLFDARIDKSGGRYAYVDGVLPGLLVEYMELPRAK